MGTSLVEKDDYPQEGACVQQAFCVQLACLHSKGPQLAWR